MAFDFPAAPALDAEYTSGGITYVFNGQGWTVKPAASGAVGDFVEVAGDTMTGALTINATTNPPLQAMNAGTGFAFGAEGTQSVINGYKNNGVRWLISMPGGGAEGGGNTGSDFSIARYADDGSTGLGNAFAINRATGDVTINGMTAINATTTGLLEAKNAGTGFSFSGDGALSAFSGLKNNGARWVIYMPNPVAESGGNAGSDFEIRGVADNGSLLPVYFSIARATGATVVNGHFTVRDNGNIYTGNAPYGPWTGRVNINSNPAAGIYGITFRPDTDANSNPCLFANAAGSGVGSITTDATATTYNTSSDERLKESLETFDAGRIVDDTQVWSFRWKSTGERAYGVSAQQAQQVYPQAVTYMEKEDWYGIDYSKYVPVLLQELKALRARVATLEGLPSVDAGRP
jgi:hypothetical protein